MPLKFFPASSNATALALDSDTGRMFTATPGSQLSTKTAVVDNFFSDGDAALCFGMPKASGPSGEANAGKIVCIRQAWVDSNPQINPINLENLPAEAGVTFQGSKVDQELGRYLINGKDLNLDGFNDLLFQVTGKIFETTAGIAFGGKDRTPVVSTDDFNKDGNGTLITRETTDIFFGSGLGTVTNPGNKQAAAISARTELTVLDARALWPSTASIDTLMSNGDFGYRIKAADTYFFDSVISVFNGNEKQNILYSPALDIPLFKSNELSVLPKQLSVPPYPDITHFANTTFFENPLLAGTLQQAFDLNPTLVLSTSYTKRNGDRGVVCSFKDPNFSTSTPDTFDTLEQRTQTVCISGDPDRNLGTAVTTTTLFGTNSPDALIVSGRGMAAACPNIELLLDATLPNNTMVVDDANFVNAGCIKFTFPTTTVPPTIDAVELTNAPDNGIFLGVRSTDTVLWIKPSNPDALSVTPKTLTLHTGTTSLTIDLRQAFNGLGNRGLRLVIPAGSLPLSEPGYTFDPVSGALTLTPQAAMVYGTNVVLPINAVDMADTVQASSNVTIATANNGTATPLRFKGHFGNCNAADVYAQVVVNKRLNGKPALVHAPTDAAVTCTSFRCSARGSAQTIQAWLNSLYAHPSIPEGLDTVVNFGRSFPGYLSADVGFIAPTSGAVKVEPVSTVAHLDQSQMNDTTGTQVGGDENAGYGIGIVEKVDCKAPIGSTWQQLCDSISNAVLDGFTFLGFQFESCQHLPQTTPGVGRRSVDEVNLAELSTQRGMFAQNAAAATTSAVPQLAGPAHVPRVGP